MFIIQHVEYYLPFAKTLKRLSSDLHHVLAFRYLSLVHNKQLLRNRLAVFIDKHEHEWPAF